MDDCNDLEWSKPYTHEASIYPLLPLTFDNLNDQHYYHSTPDSSERIFELWGTGAAPSMNVSPIDLANFDTGPDSPPRMVETLNYSDVNQTDASATQNNGYTSHFENTKLCVDDSACSYTWERPVLQQV